MEANATAANLLGTSRLILLKSKFTRFIVSDQQSQDAFYLHIKKILQTESGQDCDLEMQRSDGTRFFAHLRSLRVSDVEKGETRLRIW